jgi:hypothetical protein
MTQQRKYNPARGGHAPGHLRDALLAALVENCDNSEDEPWWTKLDITFVSLSRQIQWETWNASDRAIWLAGQLWNCRDILPGSACASAGLPQGSTYARLVRQLRSGIDDSHTFLAAGRSACRPER